MKCVAITRNGIPCTKKRIEQCERCKQHNNSLFEQGIHRTQRNEMQYIHLKERRDFEINTFDNMDVQAFHYNQLVVAQEIEKRELQLHQLQEIQRLGFDPDAEANERIRLKRIENIRLRILRQNWFNGGNREEILDEPQNELQQFANDHQNVHTSMIVEQTKKNIKTIFESSTVPVEYKWNMTECSKTPGEIIQKCHLSPESTCQMIRLYTSNESIYDLEEGIYGKVLDHVWQYISKSENKRDIRRILKSELEDNIGMCAQGNLSRLCNVLNGYLEGISGEESVSDYLGRVIPKIIEMFSENKQLLFEEIVKELKKTTLPKEHWKDWIEPAMEI